MKSFTNMTLKIELLNKTAQHCKTKKVTVVCLSIGVKSFYQLTTAVKMF